MNRWVDLDGVVNMRDLGGLPTRDGGSTAFGRLLRSDNLQDLSERDVERIVGELGVSDILDLRSETEVHTEGPGPLWKVSSLTHHNHSLLGDGSSRGDTIRAAITADPPSGRDAAFWSSHYLGYLSKRGAAVSAALDVIARSNGATIVHCAAGKDRTGTVVALALDVAEVPHEEIVADYALTAERLERIIDRLKARDLYRGALATQTLKDQLTRPETMDTILTTLTEEFGGARGWLRAHGWHDADVDRLRDRLTA